MNGFRVAGVFAAVFVLLSSACGGGGGGNKAEVEQAVKAFLTTDAPSIQPGMTSSGTIVAVQRDIADRFADTNKTIDNIEVSGVKFKKDGASANTRFRMNSFSGTATCDGAVLLTRREGKWAAALLTVSACK